MLCCGSDRSFCRGCVEAEAGAVWDPGTKPGSTPAAAAATGGPTVGGGVDGTGGRLV